MVKTDEEDKREEKKKVEYDRQQPITALDVRTRGRWNFTVDLCDRRGRSRALERCWHALFRLNSDVIYRPFSLKASSAACTATVSSL